MTTNHVTIGADAVPETSHTSNTLHPTDTLQRKILHNVRDIYSINKQFKNQEINLVLPEELGRQLKILILLQNKPIFVIYKRRNYLVAARGRYIGADLYTLLFTVY
jgi:hypothetical protein